MVWRSARGQRAHLLCAPLPLCFRVSAPPADSGRGGLLGAVARAPAAPDAALEAGGAAASADRVRRLGLLIRLRKLYRNLLRAEGLLAQAAPVYRPPPPLPGASPARLPMRACPRPVRSPAPARPSPAARAGPRLPWGRSAALRAACDAARSGPWAAAHMPGAGPWPAAHPPDRELWGARRAQSR